MSQRVEDNGGSFGDLVYSPDLQTFDLAGDRGLLSTIASFIVGPIRLTIRVTTNIFLLPAELKGKYANSLLLTGIFLELLGLVDLLVYKKWPLFVSQIPVIAMAIQMRLSAKQHHDDVITAKKEINVDTDALNDYCNTLEKELDTALGNEEN